MPSPLIRASRALALGAALVTFGASNAPEAHGQGAPSADPNAWLTGAPAIAREAGPAYFLWVDAHGWHLRWTAPAGEKKPVFTCIVRSMAGIQTIKPVMSGGDDSLNRIDEHRAFVKSALSPTAPDGIEGMDFKLPEGAEALELELFLNYKPVAPTQVRLGPLQKNPGDVSPSVLIKLKAP